jgi:hypothetical protein
MNGSGLHHSATRVLSLLMAALGIALMVQALSGHGWGRLVLGALFLAAGAGRLYIQVRRG